MDNKAGGWFTDADCAVPSNAHSSFAVTNLSTYFRNGRMTAKPQQQTQRLVEQGMTEVVQEAKWRRVGGVPRYQEDALPTTSSRESDWVT
jgi:hypothetical protein